MSKFEQGVLEEVNLARTNPQTYAKLVEDYKAAFVGNLFRRKGKVDISTNEGTAAVDEAIDFLKDQKPLDALRPSKGMSKAARDHVKDTGPKGLVGHDGSDGSTPEVRLNRHGKWLKACAENVGYGMDTPRLVVIQLIVDDGVAGRGHRKNLFNDKYFRTGILPDAKTVVQAGDQVYVAAVSGHAAEALAIAALPPTEDAEERKK